MVIGITLDHLIKTNNEYKDKSTFDTISKEFVKKCKEWGYKPFLNDDELGVEISWLQNNLTPIQLFQLENIIKKYGRKK